jgi:glutaredoxin
MPETLTTAARKAAMPFSFLTSWWRRLRARRLGHLRFVLYTRRGCHLCEDAWQCLSEAQQAYGFALEVKDVDEDPVLAARYGEQVPVVTVNGKERFRGGVNAVLLARLLRAEIR